MSIIISKGIANASAAYTSDYSNITNTNNQVIYNKIISGKTSTPMFDYLMNFQTTRINDVRSISEYNYGNISLQIAESLEMEEIVDDKTIKLPEIKKVRALKKFTLMDSLESRESVRDYVDVSMKIDVLSVLLNYSFGIKKEKNNINGFEIPKRYYGSGGGLYSIKQYLYINNVEGLEKGVYKYQPFSHSLRRMESNDLKLDDFLENQSKVIKYNNINFGVIYVYEVNKNYVKYGEISLIHSAIEIGLMNQNLHLLSQAFDIGTCDIGGFNKSILEKKINLCGVNRHVIFITLLGRGDSYVGI